MHLQTISLSRASCEDLETMATNQRPELPRRNQLPPAMQTNISLHLQQCRMRRAPLLTVLTDSLTDLLFCSGTWTFHHTDLLTFLSGGRFAG